jgi:hypothetical protein
MKTNIKRSYSSFVIKSWIFSFGQKSKEMLLRETKAISWMFHLELSESQVCQVAPPEYLLVQSRSGFSFFTLVD